jgi:hypothetical protein
MMHLSGEPLAAVRIPIANCFKFETPFDNQLPLILNLRKKHNSFKLSPQLLTFFDSVEGV